MSESFITYRKFNDPALAEQLTNILKSNGIPFSVAEEKFSFNPTFYNDATDTEYAVKVASTNFEKVDKILNQLEADQIAEVDADHYLFKFSNAELWDLIAKRDEWSNYDYQLAKKILTDRGEQISDEKIDEIEKKRLNELSIKEPPQTFWIFIGYLFALLGGIMGIFIGWHLHTYKRTLPNGQQVFLYRQADRRQGKIIFYLGIAAIVSAIIIRIILTS